MKTCKVCARPLDEAAALFGDNLCSACYREYRQILQEINRLKNIKKKYEK